MIKPLYSKITLPADKSEDGESPDRVEVFELDRHHFVVFNSYHHDDLILAQGEKEQCLETAVNLGHNKELLDQAIKAAEVFWESTRKLRMVAV